MKKGTWHILHERFQFHTAHLMHTITHVLTKQLGAARKTSLALTEYVDTFGQEYLDVLDTISLDEIYPFEVLVHGN